MVLDTKVRREMLQQAAAMGERTQFASGRLKVPTLVVLGGRTDRKEYHAEQQIDGYRKIQPGHRAIAGMVQAQDGRANQPARRRLLCRRRLESSLGERHARSADKCC